MHKHPFVEAVELVGNNQLARQLGVSPEMVSKMKRRAAREPSYLIPSRYLKPVESATHGVVTCERLLSPRCAAEEEKAA